MSCKQEDNLWSVAAAPVAAEQVEKNQGRSHHSGAAFLFAVVGLQTRNGDPDIEVVPANQRYLFSCLHNPQIGRKFI